MPRDIYIGDVHGCAPELASLLDAIGPARDDRVFFVGDLVARGPDSKSVLRLFREVRGAGVLGNHEARLLEARRARLAGEEGPPIGRSHEALLVELDAADWALLEALPLHLDSAPGVRVVHAGVDPAKPFALQERWTLLHVRSIDVDGTPSDRGGDESWSRTYRGAPHLVFGHDARRRIQIEPDATGLDSACVYGEELTAMVLPQGEPVPGPQDRRGALVSVKARDQYYYGGEKH